MCDPQRDKNQISICSVDLTSIEHECILPNVVFRSHSSEHTT